MTMAAQEPVVSGHRYTVTLVDGRRPTGLADCVGERLLTLVGNGLSHRVAGTGMEHTGRVRFHQKDLGPDGKDVRVWTISDSGGGSPLLAEHCTAAEPSSELPGSASSVRESPPRPGFPAGDSGWSCRSSTPWATHGGSGSSMAGDSDPPVPRRPFRRTIRWDAQSSRPDHSCPAVRGPLWPSPAKCPRVPFLIPRGR